jgi:hypothetical protein
VKIPGIKNKTIIFHFVRRWQDHLSRGQGKFPSAKQTLCIIFRKKDGTSYHYYHHSSKLYI